jgi:hypothetical protein
MSSRPTLEELGIHNKESQRCQQAASIPKEVFAENIKEVKEMSRACTTSASGAA